MPYDLKLDWNMFTIQPKIYIIFVVYDLLDLLNSCKYNGYETNPLMGCTTVKHNGIINKLLKERQPIS